MVRENFIERVYAYRVGQLLAVPVTLLRHHLRRHPKRCVAKQIYLNPHPHELMPRNSI